MTSDTFHIGSHQFQSRLLVGTGKYQSFSIAQAAIEASGAEIVTVAVRRAPLDTAEKASIQDYVDPKKYTYLPNTAGCHTAEDACRVLRLARQINDWKLVKLEITHDEALLYPDMHETLKAAEMLVKDGFEVMVYCTDDPVMATRLESVGCVAIMPLASPIGSGLGIQNPFNIKTIVEQSSIPVLVDAGIGTASDAAIAMELGCDGVLLNTAIACAQDPVGMATAMQLAVKSGRAAYLAGRMEKRAYAMPSSPKDGKIGKK